MPDSPHTLPIRSPHPLALALIERLRTQSNAAILEIGTGSGRNATALAQAGFNVYATRDYHELPSNDARFRAALSTHALLHGTAGQIAGGLHAIAERLHSRAPLFATFGSTNDARFGAGTRIDTYTFSSTEGDERGVAHTFFDERRLRSLLENDYEIESIQEHCVDDIVGVWAHAKQPLRKTTHWFIVASKQAT